MHGNAGSSEEGFAIEVRKACLIQHDLSFDCFDFGDDIVAALDRDAGHHGAVGVAGCVGAFNGGGYDLMVCGVAAAEGVDGAEGRSLIRVVCRHGGWTEGLRKTFGEGVVWSLVTMKTGKALFTRSRPA